MNTPTPASTFTYWSVSFCLVAALLIGLGGCAGESSSEEPMPETDTAVADTLSEEAAADTSAAVALDSTITFAESDLASVAPGAALPLIETWQEAFQEADNPALSAIASDFEVLKEELQADPIDGAAVREILVRLGEKTTTAAESADSSLAPRLEQLGSLLSEAGARGGNTQ